MSGNGIVDGLSEFWSRVTDTSNVLACGQCHSRNRSPMRKSNCVPPESPQHVVRKGHDGIENLTPRTFDPRPPSPPRPRSASPQRTGIASNLPRVNAYDTTRKTTAEHMLRCATTFPSFVPAEPCPSPDRRGTHAQDGMQERGMTPYGPAPSQSFRESISPCRVSSGCRNSYQEAMVSTPYGPVPASQLREPVTPDRRSMSPRPCLSKPRDAQQTAPGTHRTMEKAELRNLLDRHVDYYLEQHPQARERRNIVRKEPGVYEVGGRIMTVEWQHDATKKGPGQLMARDGPLLQPFSDYMEQTETNASYSSTGLKWSNLEKVPRATRMTFEDIGDNYSRLDAMKVAKEQANVREQAAQYTYSGHAVPTGLWQKYEKTMDVKLGQRWGSDARLKVAERTRPITEPTPQRPTLDSKHALTPEVSRDARHVRHGRAHSLEPSLPPPNLPPSIFGPQPDLFKMATLMRPGVNGGA